MVLYIEKKENHLKQYQQNRDEISSDNTWTIRYDIKQSNGNNNQVKPKCKVKPPIKLNL